MLQLKRVYEPAEAGDGKRILVDRLWPRGISRDAARIDAWLKDIAPSDQLRRWFGHDPGKWEEFRSRYREELREHAPLVEQLRNEADDTTITLLFAARDSDRNNAVVLKQVIESYQKESYV
ncbi:DUF488 domain-containing protein [Oryzomonas sagensis]|uniref:DUF488 domain-containing protein n=1 Tax=Oryzomonas sagensis TaxID=2603857 RepID=A0ABQ6TMG0_9BACT|nr:DUF488 domain-containing protein [Oryzomonas sagensis]KAB0669649.1 DUF488 domain-containing protein [Oryzomonas sagensis]